MKRTDMLAQIAATEKWDIIIIGGGATGLGAAVDAASRGLKTLLLERSDFAKGTSSRSTKLVHGGVRYLAQGNIKLVKEALRERGWLLQNAPHLTSVQSFVIPVFSWWDKAFYGIGLKMYELLAGSLSLGKTKILSKKETLQYLPSIQTKKLAGGILYFDGQFDDSRLSIDLAVTAANHSATLLNYCEMVGFEKTKNKITGVVCKDLFSGKEYVLATKSVINATGVFTDAVMQLDDAAKHNIVAPSQGIHLVINPRFFPGKNAMMVPKTADGRVLFAVPWHDAVVLGTTDTPIEQITAEPAALEAEIDFILDHFNRYTTAHIERKDVQSVFVGLRPLVKATGSKSTALLSRDHTILVSPSGLVTITGGKWTTYRKMAEDAVNNVLFTSKQGSRDCITRNLAIGEPEKRTALLQALMASDVLLARRIHENYPYTYAELVYAVRYELAETVEDVLARRTRLLFLDARAAASVAASVAGVMAKELGKDAEWELQQVKDFRLLAEGYILNNNEAAVDRTI